MFFIAGFETSSTTMTFSLYELASNQNIQNKLRNEIETVIQRYDGKLTYEAIMDMPYLDQVINGKCNVFRSVRSVYMQLVTLTPTLLALQQQY